MSEATVQTQDPTLTADVLAHLATQLESARRMQAIVSEQGAAIRQRVVPTVVRLAGALQVEIHRRELIERERHALLARAGKLLETAPETVSMTQLAGMMDPASATVARERQRELRELLGEIQREHRVNRVLMGQELTFLSHLLRLAGAGGGYEADGGRTSPRKTARLMRRPAFEMEA